jgi:hypothetical protein
MNVKKWIWASLAVFVLLDLSNTVIHGGILAKTYEVTASLWRMDMGSTLWIMYLSDLARFLLFTCIFIKGLENKGPAEGLRFGLWMGLLIHIGTGFGTYSYMPIPFALAVWWFVLGTVQMMLCGLAAALVYRPKKKRRVALTPAFRTGAWNIFAFA